MTLIELLAREEQEKEQDMKLWNVLVPAVGLVRAETAEDAIRLAAAKLDAVGLARYDGANAFESEAYGEPGDTGGLCDPAYQVLIDHDTYREQTGDDA